MDVSHVLTPEQRAAGLRLIEPDDHIAVLQQDGHQVAVFSQNVSVSAMLNRFSRMRRIVQRAVRAVKAMTLQRVRRAA